MDQQLCKWERRSLQTQVRGTMNIKGWNSNNNGETGECLCHHTDSSDLWKRWIQHGWCLTHTIQSLKRDQKVIKRRTLVKQLSPETSILVTGKWPPNFPVKKESLLKSEVSKSSFEIIPSVISCPPTWKQSSLLRSTNQPWRSDTDAFQAVL